MYVLRTIKKLLDAIVAISLLMSYIKHLNFFFFLDTAPPKQVLKDQTLTLIQVICQEIKRIKTKVMRFDLQI